MTEGRDKWWDEECAKMPTYCPCERMASEDPLFILYVSCFLPFIIVSVLRPRRPLVPLVNLRVLSTALVVTSSVPLLPSNTSLTPTPTTDLPVWPILDGLPGTVTSFTVLLPTASPPPSLNPPLSTPHHPDTGTLSTSGRLLSSTPRPLLFDC